jgi:excisionase family DNA binding protein
MRPIVFAFLAFLMHHGRMEEELIRTGEAARILGASRQHVVDLCTRGVLRAYGSGVHRRLRRSDVRALAEEPRLGRQARQSLWLHRLVAAHLASAPDAAIAKARRNLRLMRAVHEVRPPWVDRWERILVAGPEEIMRVLGAETAEAIELRQNSPFAGVLSERERSAALRAFRAVERPVQPPSPRIVPRAGSPRRSAPA